MQAMSDRSIDVDDLVEENKYLRQELFALCDRIREAEAWTRSHRREECGPVTDTDQTGETNDTDQLAVLESEIVQIRLTNFELLQKLKQLETARIQAQEESKRMERELQRLLPSALEVTRLQKALDASQAQHRRLQLAHRAAAVVWSRSAEQHRRSQSQQCASQATHDELALQYQEQQLQLSRKYTFVVNAVSRKQPANSSRRSLTTSDRHIRRPAMSPTTAHDRRRVDRSSRRGTARQQHTT